MSTDLSSIKLGYRAEVIGGKLTNHFEVPIITGNYVNISLQLNILGYDHGCISVPKLVSTFPFDCWWPECPPFQGIIGRGPIKIDGINSDEKINRGCSDRWKTLIQLL